MLRYKDSTIVSEIYFSDHYYYLAYFLLSLLQLTANCVVRLMVSIYSLRGYRRRLFAEAKNLSLSLDDQLSCIGQNENEDIF